MTWQESKYNKWFGMPPIRKDILICVIEDLILTYFIFIAYILPVMDIDLTYIEQNSLSD